VPGAVSTVTRVCVSMPQCSEPTHTHTARSMLCTHTQLPLWYDTCAHRRSVLARVDVDMQMRKQSFVLRCVACWRRALASLNQTRALANATSTWPHCTHTHFTVGLCALSHRTLINYRCLTGQKRMMGSSNACARCTRGLLQASDRATGAVHHTHTGRRQARVLTCVCVCVCVRLGDKW
jgi:hypothetical protein